jgi:hypothetical protein
LTTAGADCFTLTSKLKNRVWNACRNNYFSSLATVIADSVSSSRYTSPCLLLYLIDISDWVHLDEEKREEWKRPFNANAQVNNERSRRELVQIITDINICIILLFDSKFALPYFSGKYWRQIFDWAGKKRIGEHFIQ